MLVKMGPENQLSRYIYCLDDAPYLYESYIE